MVWGGGVAFAQGDRLLETPRYRTALEHVGVVRHTDVTGQDPVYSEHIVRFQFVQQDPPIRTDVNLVSSGDASPIAGYVFGGRLDSEEQMPGEAGNTFRGVVVNQDYVAFYASLVQSFDPEDPFKVGDKIGIFRVDLSVNPPTIESIALHGQPVNDSLFVNDLIFNNAVWEFPPYSASTLWDMSLPPRNQPFRGWVAPLSMNENGWMAFRALVRFPGGQNPPIYGGIFVHNGSPVQLFMAAIENIDSRRLISGLEGVGNVIPKTLGPPVINSQGVIAFYSLTTGSRVGVFVIDGPWYGFTVRSVLHGGQLNFEDLGPTIRSIINVPAQRAPWSAGVEASIFAINWFDQPDINCNGDLAFRARIEEDILDEEGNIVGSESKNVVVRWIKLLENTGTERTILFKQGDPLPPRRNGEDVLPTATIDQHPNIIAKILYPPSTFSKPTINGFGEVTVIAQILDDGTDPNDNDGDEVLLSFNTDGLAETLARTRSTQFQFADPQTGQIFQIRAFGSYEDEAKFTGAYEESYFKSVLMNDRGQLAVQLNTLSVATMTQFAGIGVAERDDNDLVLGELNVGVDQFAIPLGSLLLSGGSAQSGDSGMQHDGVSVAIWRVGTENSIAGVDLDLSLADDTNHCLADLNGDNVVDTSDLGILLGQFGDPCPCTADINDDGAVDTADLGILLTVFGEYCDGCINGATGAPESLMAGPGSAQPTPLLNELGFTSVEGYITWLDSLTPELLLEHLEECAELIQLAE